MLHNVLKFIPGVSIKEIGIFVGSTVVLKYTKMDIHDSCVYGSVTDILVEIKYLIFDSFSSLIRARPNQNQQQDADDGR